MERGGFAIAAKAKGERMMARRDMTMKDVERLEREGTASVLRQDEGGSKL